MRDGMYGVEYTSVAGAGLGVVILDSGRVFGADPFGGKYDGDYTYNEEDGHGRAPHQTHVRAELASGLRH